METNQVNVTSSYDKIASVITNKRTRSLFFLILTFFLILLINGLLPLISGKAHYTAEDITVSYKDYVILKTNNNLYDITYATQMRIKKYKEDYLEYFPDLTPEEILLIEPP